MHLNREDFTYWLDQVIDKAIPTNHDEFTRKQLIDYAFGVVYDALDKAQISPADTDYILPDLDPLFDFIDDGTRSESFLRRAFSGELSFRSCFDVLRSHNCLPRDSAQRIWRIVLRCHFA